MSTQKELTDLCVMVTRPKPQGEVLCEQIQMHGGEAIYFPSLDIIPSDSLFQLHRYDCVIFISPQAVYQSVQRIRSFPPQIAAMGTGTATALHAVKLPVHVYPLEEWNSEGLLALPEFQNITNKKMAIIKGEGGREFLSQVLEARGAQVDLLIAYRRALPQQDVSVHLDLLRKQRIDMIICTSQDGVQNIKILLQDEWSCLQQVPLLVISERIAKHADELGFKYILQAKNASFEAILEALIRFKKSQNQGKTNDKSY